MLLLENESSYGTQILQIRNLQNLVLVQYGVISITLIGMRPSKVSNENILFNNTG